MQETSNLWKQIVALESSLFDVKVVIEGTEYTVFTSPPKISRYGLPDELSVGGALGSSLKVSILPIKAVPKQAKMEVFIRALSVEPTVYIGDEKRNKISTEDDYILVSQKRRVSEWLPLGTFWVNKRSKDKRSGVETFEAFDAMRRADAMYIDQTGIYPMAMSQAVQYIAAAIGVSVDPRSQIANYTIDNPTNIYTYREILQSIAAASGGNFVITETNKLRLVPLSSPSGGGTSLVSKKAASSGEATISRVTLEVDENVVVTAGNDSGYEIKARCISLMHYDDQQKKSICNSVLNKITGVKYNAVNTNTTLYDPASEVGDTITTAGYTFGLYNYTIVLGRKIYADVSSPFNEEVENEFPYLTTTEKDVQRMNGSFSEIRKDTERIELEVVKQTEELREETRSLIAQTSNNIMLEVNKKTDSSEVESLIDVGLESITLSVSNGENSSTIKIEKDGIEVDSAQVKFTKIIADEVNAEDIRGNIYADQIHLGGDMTIYQGLNSNVFGGFLGYTAGSLGGAGIHMATGASEVVATMNGANMIFDIQGIETTQAYVSAAGFGVDANVIMNGYLVSGGLRFNGYSFIPTNDGQILLGADGYRWRSVWATEGVIQTSDRRKKRDISYDMERFDKLFDKLKPARFRMKGEEQGSIGLIAQDIEAALKECGIDEKDFGALVKGEDGYSLKYTEFIPMCIDEIQKLKKRVKKLEEGNG